MKDFTVSAVEMKDAMSDLQHVNAKKKGPAYTNTFSKILASPCFGLFEMEF